MTKAHQGSQKGKRLRIRRPVPRDEFYGLRLLPKHADLLRASAINRRTARERGYWSATRRSELIKVGFSPSQSRVPALVIPVHDVFGEIRFHVIRPDSPRVDDQGRPKKYEMPAGVEMAIDVPPRVREQLGDPEEHLWITEGSRKADAGVSMGLCCISLMGVWNWRGANAQGGATALGDWEAIHLKGRDVAIVFDSDVSTNAGVSDAATRLANFLESRGAVLSYAVLSEKCDE